MAVTAKTLLPRSALNPVKAKSGNRQFSAVHSEQSAGLSPGLSRAIGNRQFQKASGNPCSAVQRKAVNSRKATNEQHEHEADRLAKSMVRKQPAKVTRFINGGFIQAKADHHSTRKQGVASRTFTNGGGRALPVSLQQQFSESLGENLNHVRIHTDGRAARSSAEISARAFTHGNDIYFAQGQYNPNTQQGQELLAHEVVHTVQQKSDSVIQRDKDPTREDVLEVMNDIEEGENIHELAQNEEFRVEIKEVFEDLGIPFEAAKRLFLEYKHEYDREITEAVNSAKQVDLNKITDAYKTIRRDLVTEFETTRNNIRQEMENQKRAGNDLTYLDLQMDWVNALESRNLHEAYLQVDAHFHDGPTVKRGDIFSLLAELPYPDNFDHDKARRVIDDVNAAVGDHRAAAELINPAKVSIWFWVKVLFTPLTDKQETEKAVERIENKTGEEVSEETQKKLEGMTQEDRQLFVEYVSQKKAQGSGDSTEKMLEKFRKLTDLQKKILEANRLLNKKKKGSTEGDIQLTTADVSGIIAGPQAMQGIQGRLDLAKQAAAEYNAKISGGGKKVDVGFSLLDKLLSSFQTEMVMFKGLLRGASTRYPELKTFEGDILDLIEKLFEALAKQMREDLALDFLLAPIPGAWIYRLKRKVEKIMRFVDALRSVVSIKDTVNEIVQRAQQAKTDIKMIEAKLAELEQLGDEEEIEELVFQLIDRYSLMDYIILPEFEGLSDAEIHQEIMKIIRDIPAGLNAFTDMYQIYHSMPDSPSAEELSMLGVTSVIAGALLSPMVKYLTLKTLEKAKAAISNFDRSIMDRFLQGRRNRRGGRRPKSNKEDINKQKDKTQKKMASANPNNFDYKARDVKGVIEKQYKPLLEGKLNDPANSLGNKAWTEEYFKDFIKAEVKKLNQQRGRYTIHTKLKKKKAADPDQYGNAPMLPISLNKGVSFNTRRKPWRAFLKIQKIVRTGTVEITTTPANFEELEYSHFGAGAGIAYAEANMTGEHKQLKKEAIEDWFAGKISSKHGASKKRKRYEFTYEVDPATAAVLKSDDKKHLRMPDDETKPGPLKIDSGYVKHGLDSTLYTKFLGKRLSGAVLSRITALTASNMGPLLPPGYYAKKEKGAVKIKIKHGSGLTTKLYWDGGLLTDIAPSETPLDRRTIRSGDFKEHNLNTAEIDQMIDNMFEKDSAGAVKTPEVFDSATYKNQGSASKPLNTRQRWRDYINSKPDLKKRPTEIRTNLGYTVNKKRGSLSSKYLPELKDDDDKGHLVAARFNGPDDLFNLVPMNSDFNQKGAWQRIEREMAQTYIGNASIRGGYVNLYIKLHYPNNVRRPDFIDVTWKQMKGGVAARTGGGTGLVNP